MSFKSHRLVEFIRGIQNSLFMWFLISYGTMYLIGIFTIKNIYSQFENDFVESIALQSLENRTKNIEYVKNYFNFKNPFELNSYIASYNESGINIYSIITTPESPSLILDDGHIWKNIHWNEILLCAHASTLCKNPMMRAHNLGVDSQSENYFVYAAPLEINHKKYINLNLIRPSKIIVRNLSKIRSTERFSQIIILISFMCFIFISYGAVRPINLFIKKLQNQRLQSENFKSGTRNELNHVKYIRSTIYEALVRKEQQEQERLAMQNTLLSQQKEAEIGKIVSQISHDLKSPLIIFEDMLRENSVENFSKNYDAAKRSLNKILSLVQSLKQADKESILERSLSPLVTDGILNECKTYAKTKGLAVETHIAPIRYSLVLDHQKVERSLNNLIRNAVEYARTKVILSIQLLGADLKIQICDDGTGVPDEILPRLFQWRNTGNQTSGTGIGLYYARQVARAHGGEVTYEHNNGLTCFTMTLPGVLSSSEALALAGETLAPVETPQTLESVPAVQKVACFYLQNKQKNDAFQAFMRHRGLSSVFLSEPTVEADLPSYSVLYTDTGSELLDYSIENGIPVILSKEDDTPELVYERLCRSYPFLT